MLYFLKLTSVFCFVKLNQIDNDYLCYFCNEKKPDEVNYPCRICTKVFHMSCYEQKGRLRSKQERKLLLQAFSNIGWSCYDCVSPA